MNFFRMRIINTLLLFFIGIMLGYVLKDHFFPAKKDSVRQQPYYNYAGFVKAKEPLDNFDKKSKPEQSLSGKNRNDDKQEVSASLDDEEDVFDLPVKELEHEYNKSSTGGSGRDSNLTEIEGEYEKFTDAEAFLKAPNRYRGKEIEIDIEMIVAKNTGKGWRLNFLHQREDKGIDYIYIDDDSVLAPQPDLKIGYFYKVRFVCGGGLNAGNKLISIKPTGDKAPWATDLSAIE